MNNPSFLLALAAVSLITLSVGCSREEAAATPASVNAAKTSDSSAAEAPASAQAAEQKGAEALKAAEAQKQLDAVAAQRAEASKADQALRATTDKLAAEHAAAETQAALLAEEAKVQAMVDSAKKLSSEKKWGELLQILGQLANEKLSPAQQDLVNDLRATAQKEVQAGQTKKAVSSTGSASGGLPEPKK